MRPPGPSLRQRLAGWLHRYRLRCWHLYGATAHAWRPSKGRDWPVMVCTWCDDLQWVEGPLEAGKAGEGEIP